ncbi:hypothetical protein Ae201684P_010087 [Aphanomyces euteiches]|uniref:Uncharacterized protein n=1 Tax=Aphanomyces euteiches TaxID=100861 RepID=A0A6G0X042_9STRA|nr:hypothetical protein Ae201684_009960 [Aphanomyces euteiches]KAH9095877.1 hypothetical protein Ae201684P_010087 [Aphanomyces euteiches]KAH9139698.1 hypothetical protein AeRB84_016043 [Aphanomyces euteiches]
MTTLPTTRALPVSVCSRCGGRSEHFGPNVTYDGMNFCAKPGCPRRQVCAFRCVKHNRSFDMDPTKVRVYRFCHICRVDALALGEADVNLHQYIVPNVEIFITRLRWIPLPLPNPSPTVPPVRLVFKRKRRKGAFKRSKLRYSFKP